MKISSVRIKNFRSFRDVTVALNDYTCLVGPNGAGKSTVLCALNVFFGETENAVTDLRRLAKQDFHRGNVGESIEITVTFGDLTEEAQADFSDYYRNDQLVISAVATFCETAGHASVKQRGQRLGIEDFTPFFEAYGDGKAAELKMVYANIRRTYADLPATPSSKLKMRDALRDYETRHQDRCRLIPSEDEFYGFSKGKNRLAKYIQWVYVPAVKDASVEQTEAKNTALGKLLARTVRSRVNFVDEISELRRSAREKYQSLLEENQAQLVELSKSLRARLSEWSHPGVTLKLEWFHDEDRSIKVSEPLAQVIVGEGDFEGDLARLGHGVQRSYLLALLQELATVDSGTSPRLILGCEEPELHQHPPQARHLAGVMRKLSADNAQIVVSTHQPVFVLGDAFEDVRMVRRISQAASSAVTSVSYEAIADAIAEASGRRPKKIEAVEARIVQALQPSLAEMFFSRRLVLVEGIEDVAFIYTYLQLMEKWNEYRHVGCHVVPANAKSQLLRAVAIARELRIPMYVVFDADGDVDERDGRKIQHLADNRALLKLLGAEGMEPMPQHTTWGRGFTMWPLNIAKSVESDIGAGDWCRACQMADTDFGHTSGMRKNPLYIGAALRHAWNNDRRSEQLERLCDMILDPSNTVPCS